MQPTAPKVQEGEYVVPTFKQDVFNCPFCGVLATQFWTDLLAQLPGGSHYASIAAHVSICLNCEGQAFWVSPTRGKDADDAVMVVPEARGGPRPHVEMPDDVRKDYEEARRIVSASPRGACALLRFALQTLLQKHLGQGGKSPNEAIKALVAAGLPVETQQALDVLRVVGNNAVHPLEMNLRDDTATATALFTVVNFIVQDRIAQPKKLKGLFDALPQGARDAIAKRDGTS